MNLEIQKYIKEYVDRMQAKGITPTIEQINAHLANLIHNMNNAPKEGFEGYSSSEISKVLYEPFDSDSVLQFNSLTSEQYNQMPIFRQVKYLLQTLAEHEIKLTAAGFLPVGFAKSSSGEYAGGIFWVVAIALVASWLVRQSARPGPA